MRAERASVHRGLRRSPAQRVRWGKGRGKERIWSFRRKGGGGRERVFSDAEGGINTHDTIEAVGKMPRDEEEITWLSRTAELQ